MWVGGWGGGCLIRALDKCGGALEAKEGHDESGVKGMRGAAQFRIVAVIQV